MRWDAWIIGAVMPITLALASWGQTAHPSSEKPIADAILWSADMETGDLSQWTHSGSHGGSYDSGNCIRPQNGVSSEHAHSGRYSMKLTIDTSVESGCRQFRHEEAITGKPLYYSAWFYIPQYYHPLNYWNVFQFKSEAGGANEPFWVVDVMARSQTGALHLVLRWKGAVEGPAEEGKHRGTRRYDQAAADVPVGKWFRIEAFLQQSSDAKGELVVWQDGVQLWDMQNVKTKFPGGDQRWSVNNYSDKLIPSPATLYIDDAEISVTRVP